MLSKAGILNIEHNEFEDGGKVSMPGLESLVAVLLDNNDELATVDLSGLVEVRLGGATSCTTSSYHNGVRVHTNPDLAELDVSALSAVECGLLVTGNAMLENFELADDAVVRSFLMVRQNPGLSGKCKFGALVPYDVLPPGWTSQGDLFVAVIQNGPDEASACNDGFQLDVSQVDKLTGRLYPGSPSLWIKRTGAHGVIDAANLITATHGVSVEENPLVTGLLLPDIDGATIVVQNNAGDFDFCCPAKAAACLPDGDYEQCTPTSSFQAAGGTPAEASMETGGAVMAVLALAIVAVVAIILHRRQTALRRSVLIDSVDQELDDLPLRATGPGALGKLELRGVGRPSVSGIGSMLTLETVEPIVYSTLADGAASCDDAAVTYSHLTGGALIPAISTDTTYCDVSTGDADTASCEDAQYHEPAGHPLYASAENVVYNVPTAASPTGVGAERTTAMPLYTAASEVTYAVPEAAYASASPTAKTDYDTASANGVRLTHSTTSPAYAEASSKAAVDSAQHYERAMLAEDDGYCDIVEVLVAEDAL